jgi:NADH-quinone oxidoreductase subunit L
LTLGWITLGLPLLACVVLALWPHEPARALTRPLAVFPAAIGFVMTLVTFLAYRERPDDERFEVGRLWEWIDIGGLPVDLAIQIDDLSVYMMLVITGVGSLILLFALSYMEEDRDYRRFFAKMNFFVFAMLLLVMAANYLFLIVGWGLVGLASYLLIGFYYWKPSAVAAAKKAFVMNVIGDVGLVLAGFLLVRELGTLDYEQVFLTAPEGLGDGTGVAEAVGLLLLVGAVAKSAQLPLHTWLEGSMEGPTPVSALLHAATMVTAGVYLIVRSADLYQLAPIASDTAAVIGAATLFMAATIAIVQEDIKRVLAWSTVSQIGYMIMAAGLGLYTAAMFHLMMHAFFKALLFLSAGAVIHALHGEQSLDRMGGLRRHLPITTVGFLVGAFALGGVIPFSGYFSKDEIIELGTDRGAFGITLAVIGALGAILTCFYAFRAYFRAFHGPDRPEGYAGLHKPDWKMLVPISVLSILAFGAGWIQPPKGWHLVDDWLEPALEGLPEYSVGWATIIEWSLFTQLGGIAAIGIAWWLFASGPARRLRYANKLPRTRALLERKYAIEEIYDEALVEPGKDLGETFLDKGEPGLTQGIVRAGVDTSRWGATALRHMQNGLVRTYVMVLISGAAIIGVVFILAAR